MNFKNLPIAKIFKFFVPSIILVILAVLGVKFQFFNLLAVIVFFLLCLTVVVAFIFGLRNTFKEK